MNIRECRTWQQVHDLAKPSVSLGGWQTHNDSYIMYQGALELKPGDRALVIGVYGGAQVILLKMVQPEAEVWAIDPFCNETHWKNNGVHLVDHYYEQLRFAGLEGQINTLEKYSQEVGPTWDKPLNWALVDGDHSEEAAYSDLTHFAKHVVVGGLLYVDDMNATSAVRTAFNRWLAEEHETTDRRWTIEVRRSDEEPAVDKVWQLRRTA